MSASYGCACGHCSAPPLYLGIHSISSLFYLVGLRVIQNNMPVFIVIDKELRYFIQLFLSIMSLNQWKGIELEGF